MSRHGSVPVRVGSRDRAAAAPRPGRINFDAVRAIWVRGVQAEGRQNLWLALAGFCEPIYYLVALGLGVGALIGDTWSSGSRGPYLYYIAPGLLAVSVMNGALYVCMNNAFLRIRYTGVYNALLSGPVGSVELVLGEVAVGVTRSGIYAAGFVAIGCGLSSFASVGGAVLSLPVCLIVGMAFGAVGLAIAFIVPSQQHLAMVRLAMLPLVLFSGAMYPISVLPEWLQMVIVSLPLWHGVELLRAVLMLQFGGVWLHLVYFVVMALLGLWVAERRVRARLLA